MSTELTTPAISQAGMLEAIVNRERVVTRVVVGHGQARAVGLYDAYSWHRSLYNCFPGTPPGKQPFLFRTDFENRITAIIISETQPVPLCWGQWESHTLAVNPYPQQVFAFSLRANPTVKAGKKRKPLCTAAEHVSWLYGQAQQHGFSIQEMEASPHWVQTNPSKGLGVKHTLVDFKGLCTVTDPIKFTYAIFTGIGRARAFGCGMLQVIPIST